MIGSTSPRLGVSEMDKRAGQWAGKRVLLLDQAPAFELSYWCGTCPFLFERQAGANKKLSLEALSDALNAGISEVDPAVVEAFGRLLPCGEFIPLLVTASPRLVNPSEDGDYFSEEEVATWGVDSFWGLPEYPRTPYYRAFETRIDDGNHLFEFIVPLVPPSWNQASTVARHRDALSRSAMPTAVALTILDICRPADEEGDDYYGHWCLTHYLLDGHHKIQAAAESGSQLQLLSLLSIDQSLASRDDLLRVPSFYSREHIGRRQSEG